MVIYFQILVNKVLGYLKQVKCTSTLLEILCLMLLVLSACNSDESSVSSLHTSESDGIPSITITEDFVEKEYSMEIGDTQTFSLVLSPQNLELSDIIIFISDTNIINASEESMKTGLFSRSSKLSFTITAFSEGTSTLYVMSESGTIKSNEIVFFVEKPTKIESFGRFKPSSFTMYVDDTEEVSWTIMPKGLLREDVDVLITDNSVISVEELSFSDDNSSTQFIFSVIGLSEGQSEIVLRSANGKIESEPLEITVTTPPIIKGFGVFEQDSYYMETGDSKTFNHSILPSGLSREDVIVELSDDSVISFTEKSFSDEDDITSFVYTITALSPGKSTLTLKSSDGKTTAKALTFYVSEKDTSRTVYITPTGKRYHFSAACAGENAIPTTLNQVKSIGNYTPCQKCAN